MWNREEAFRFYVADELYFMGQNKSWNIDYADFLDKLEKPIEPMPDGDAIVEEIMAKYELRFKDECI